VALGAAIVLGAWVPGLLEPAGIVLAAGIVVLVRESAPA
jgi:hypothetical protein